MDHKIEIVDVNTGYNMIVGTTHFLKSVEDIYECVINCVPGAQFGLAFAEASGDALIRHEGTDDKLVDAATEIAQKLACGHTFVIVMEEMYPINILPRLKDVPEMVNIFCATQNPVQFIVCETEQGRGILGVIDGIKPKGVENKEKKEERKDFIRKIGYKF